MKTVIEQLKKISSQLEEQNSILKTKSYLDSKSIWTLQELCAYTGYEESYIKKLTSAGKLPHYKPGKYIYFERDVILAWIRSHPVQGEQEIVHEIATLFTPKAARP